MTRTGQMGETRGKPGCQGKKLYLRNHDPLGGFHTIQMKRILGNGETTRMDGCRRSLVPELNLEDPSLYTYLGRGKLKY